MIPTRLCCLCWAALCVLCAGGDACAQAVMLRRAEAAPASQPAGVLPVDRLADTTPDRPLLVRLEAPNGPVTVRLSRFRVVAPDALVIAVGPDGRERRLERTLDRALMVRGDVVGVPGSHVFIGITPSGVSGRLEWSAGRPDGVTFGGSLETTDAGVRQARLHARRTDPSHRIGAALGCRVTHDPDQRFDAGASGQPADRPAAGRGTIGGAVARAPGFRRIELGIDSDYELFQRFGGDAQVAADYLTLLYGTVADLFLRDTDTVLAVTFMRVWQSPVDPYDSDDLLSAVRVHWESSMGFVSRDAAQLASGRQDLRAGGEAFLSTLCSQSAYSYAGYLVGFDPRVGYEGLVYPRDIILAAHELGHCIAAPHTHDVGIDLCVDPFAAPQRGTIMSYCGQSYSGDAANADLRFHPEIIEILDREIRTDPCVDHDCNLNGVPDSTDIAMGTSPDVNGDGIPDGCQDCDANGMLDPDEIAADWTVDADGDGRLDACAPDCNTNGVPDSADINGAIGPVLIDEFETDLGWTVDNSAAGNGGWVRAVPIAQNLPMRDSDGSGQCYVTGNIPTIFSLDDSALLTSPEFDGSIAPTLAISYAYYYFGAPPAGSDPATHETGLRVDVTSLAMGGTWATVAYHREASLFWQEAVLDWPVLNGAGVVLSPQMRVRFVAIASGGGNADCAIDDLHLGPWMGPTDVDLDEDGRPDGCQDDCDSDLVIDTLQINLDMSLDRNRNAILDSCEDCDQDGTPDLDEIAGANEVWAVERDAGSIHRFLWGTGTATVNGGSVLNTAVHDLLIDPLGRVLLSCPDDDRVAMFDADGAFVGDLVGPGGGGLDLPGGMIVSNGRLLVASRANDSVIAYDLATGAPLGALIAPGPGDGGIVGPRVIAAGAGGDLYVACDDDQVRRFNADGTFVGLFVTATDNGELSQPRGIVFLPTGDLIVSSAGTNEILRYDGLTGAFIERFNHNTHPQTVFLDEPWTLRIGPDGDVYVARAAGNGEAMSAPGMLSVARPRVFQLDGETGHFIRGHVQGEDSGVTHVTGFDFLPHANLDCNLNLRPDNCEIADGDAADLNDNGIIDACEGLDPCFVDWNDDEVVDVVDLLAYLTLWFPRDAPADVTFDEVTDIVDLLVFLVNWFAGC